MLTRRQLLALPGVFALSGLGLSGRVRAAADKASRLPVYVDLFDKAFRPGFSWKMQLSEKGKPQDVPFTVVDGGKLKISSGQISACDPFVATQVVPFTQAVPKGAFAVRLACPQVNGKAGGRVAFARVDFSAEPITHWQMALAAGEDLAKLPEGELYGYPVASGTGSFADQKTYEAAIAMTLKNEPVVDEWMVKGDESGKAVGLGFFLNQAIDQNNIIMFQSGWGDGFYASYFGTAANGAVVALLTDFAVLE